MTFLPIVERELRVAARRKATRRVRLWTTVAALGLSFFFILAYQIFRGQSHELGRALFRILSYYAFGLALLAGILLTADCLSEEKREGTLGLLFLTDLKGYDVVLGKMLAVGLNALYGLLAALPVLGLPLLMGGVTVGEFWRMAIALLNALFFSLTLGMLVSSWSRDSLKAIGNTLGLLTAATVGAPVMGWVLSRFGLPSGWWQWTWFSPYSPFSYATYTYAGRYWTSLVISDAAAWMFLFLASLSLPRTWQDQPYRARFRFAPQQARAAAPTQGPGARTRRPVGDQNPVVWLMKGYRGAQSRMWLLAIAGSGIVLLMACAVPSISGPMTLSFGPAWFFGVLMKIVFAFQASRLFVEARRSGALDLLLSTPITGRELIDGQWRGLGRMFLWPVLVFTAARAASILIEFGSDSNVSGLFVFIVWHPIVRFLLDLAAIGWLGMWLGLTAKKPSLAPALTILFGLVLPGVLCFPTLLIDVGIILWSRARLLKGLRRDAMPQYYSLGPVRVAGA